MCIYYEIAKKIPVIFEIIRIVVTLKLPLKDVDSSSLKIISQFKIIYGNR